METIAFLAIATVGVIGWLLDVVLWPGLGLILTIAMSAAFIVHAIEKGHKKDDEDKE